MKVKGLEGLDLCDVPLPNGTEVTTTVTRVIPGSSRVVPQGAVGRVVALEGDQVTLRVVGVGEVTFPRKDVIPRKRGQVKFALRRANLESALRPCAILISVVGSRAWGLSEEGSDVDRRGVFLLPFTWTTGLGDPPDVIVSADGSETFWELERTIEQALRADPNTLEMLFVPEIEVKNPVGQALLDHREAFISTKIYGSFGRYALAQAKKLEQSLRLAEHRAMVLEWLREDHRLTLDQVADRLATSALDPADDNSPRRAKQYLKQLYRSMHDQGLLEGATFESLIAFASHRSAQLELPRDLRPKNAYNLLRIVSCAVQWLETGEPLIRVKGELKDRLLSIKQGEVALRKALNWTEQMASRLDEARIGSPLPERPNVAKVDEMLREARRWAARQWADETIGPWGADAPDVPMTHSRGESDE